MKKTKTCDARKLLYLASYVFKNAKSMSILQICYLLAKKSFFQKCFFATFFGIKGEKLILKIGLEPQKHACS